ncbi:MAG: hypothetical protein FVQ79_08555 [Planctomycetes bacterium]|nr:hypothetical protein [Planctomycetota bacterium]
MFDEEFVKQLPQNSLEAQMEICKKFNVFNDSFPDDRGRSKAVEEYLKALAFVDIYTKIQSIDTDASLPELKSDHKNITKVDIVVNFFTRWMRDLKEKLRVVQHTNTYETAKDYYASMFGKGVFYEFSDGDFSRVQTLLNNLRDLLTNSTDFEEDYRSRLLKKLEALQSEVHKKMSDFDRFWGFFIDSGIALSKFWENAKPFRDDIKEIVEIVSRTQAKAENVQKFFPLNLLKSGDDSDSASNAK